MMRDKNIAVEVAIRFILFIVFTVTDDAEPYRRSLQPEELWLYRYPHIPDIYPGKLMWCAELSKEGANNLQSTHNALQQCIGSSSERLNKIQSSGRTATSLQSRSGGVTMSIYISGCITNIVKLVVGRPRPDFLARCYPNGLPDHMDFARSVNCPGDEQLVLNGMKSFPSSHSSLSFSSLGFVSLYLAGKLHVFNQGRGHGWRFVAFIIPLLWALMIAVSRTSDYHHHWQDVTVGSIIGLVVCYACYHQVYPCLHKAHSHLCNNQLTSEHESQEVSKPESVVSVSPLQQDPLQKDVTLISKLV